KREFGRWRTAIEIVQLYARSWNRLRTVGRFRKPPGLAALSTQALPREVMETKPRWLTGQARPPGLRAVGPIFLCRSPMPSLRKRRLHAFHNSWCNFSCCKRRLPRNGKEHPFVENTTVGSAVTILIMAL